MVEQPIRLCKFLKQTCCVCNGRKISYKQLPKQNKSPFRMVDAENINQNFGNKKGLDVV